MKKIGIFGGAFDPPHRGHKVALRTFLTELALDEVFVLPCGVPPHKTLDGGANGAQRLALCRLAFEDCGENVTVSDFEIRKEGKSYSFETVLHFRKTYPQARLYLYVGTDEFEQFEFWKNPEIILQNATLCVLSRNRDPAELTETKRRLEEKFGVSVLQLQGNADIMNSSEIRRDLAERHFSDRLSPEVNDYIEINGLYGSLATDPERARILDLVKKSVSEARLKHTLSVEREVFSLCRALKVPSRDLCLAALLHDLAKSRSEQEQLKALEALGDLSGEDRLSPAVLHGHLASYKARDLGLSESACRAIYYHTTGRERMTTPEMVLFYADFIEETRRYRLCREERERFYKAVAARPENAKKCLEDGVLRVLEMTVEYLKNRNEHVHAETLAALAHYKNGKETL